MGGIVKIIKVDPIPEVRKLPPIKLHKMIWHLVENFIISNISTRYYEEVFEYLDGVYQGYKDGRWSATENKLYYDFGDFAGLCGGSLYASLHWFEISFAALQKDIDRKAMKGGYQIIEPRRSVVKLLKNGPEFPLVQLRKRMYCIGRKSNSNLDIEIPYIFTNETPNALTFQDLTATEQALVEQIASTGQCACPLCECLRKQWL